MSEDETVQGWGADARLERQLLQGGVGMRHVRRTLRELRDHREDLQARLLAQGLDQDAAGHEAELTLGDRDRLAAQMIARPELRSRIRRFAWLLFVLGPVTMIAALSVLAIMVGALLFEGSDALLDLRLTGPQEIAGTQMLLQWIVPGAVGLLLCRTAVCRAVPAIWPICANAMTALTSGYTHVSGTTRVTGIHFWPGYGEELARALVFFVLLSAAYLLLRYTRSRRMHDA